MAPRSVEVARRAARLDDPAEGLAAVRGLRREVESLEVEQVRHALDQGWSWRRVAEALGVSKQAAHKKHAAGPPQAGAPQVEGRQRLVITGQARRAVEYAREEARLLGHPAVEPAHLLLGLLRSGDGAARTALEAAALDLDSTRRDARTMRPASPAEDPAAASGRVPVSPRARGAFEQALREAVARGDEHLGMEHILLALLRDSESGAPATLGRLGVAPRRLGRLLERAIAEGAASAPG